MGLLQLYLRPGKQRVNLTTNIPKGSVTLKHLYASFNVENHGFYLLQINTPFLYTNNTQSNTDKRGLLLPLQHDKSSTIEELNLRLGELEIPKNFEVDIDLDNGHQVVIETDTRSGATFPFNIHPATPFFRNEDYVLNPPGGAYVSLGLNADKILDGSIPHSSGVIDGPQPFMYCLLLTLEYDDGLVEERLQQLLS